MIKFKRGRYYYNTATDHWPKLLYYTSTGDTKLVGYTFEKPYGNLIKKHHRKTLSFKTGIIKSEGFKIDKQDNTDPYILFLEPLKKLSQIKFKYSLMIPDIKFCPKFKPT